MLDDQGCTFIGQEGTLKIENEGKKTEKNVVLELWHRRLSHISEKGLNELIKQGLIQSRGTKRLSFCEHCVYGKYKRMRFTKEEHTTKAILDYVHGDLWGSSKVVSWGNSRCTTYVHTKQSKVEPRAIKCMFIGYPEGVKGYKC
ncbi:putative polyprotein [Cucumis melo var. makuwa]|uniref:Polyprotein n=1 Tax=Cucumis melo var. makuwa TaxID=1194695 RepID=A0A5A7VCV7_CUCMM|nr:putative polyprotein [Cucumis melo var. makuwa]TYK15212.1 putative polyprotein [Cucumis melo var. makuwa]